MGVLQTQFEFSLPKGYIDDKGNLHKDGKMRLSTAADEILPMKDPRVQGNPAYLTVILLSRVVTSLGSLDMITTKVIEDLFSGDFNYLQEMYSRINQNGSNTIRATCPKCENKFDIEVNYQGE
jgi:hypothetical protein